MGRMGEIIRKRDAVTSRTRTTTTTGGITPRGALLFALVLALRSCASCAGATVSTSWPFKVHGKAADDNNYNTADSEVGTAGQPTGGDGGRVADDPAAEVASGGPHTHLGVPGECSVLLYDIRRLVHTAVRVTHDITDR